MAEFSSTFGGKYTHFTSGGVYYRVEAATDNLQALDPVTDTWSDATAVADASERYRYQYDQVGRFWTRLDTTTDTVQALSGGVWGSTTSASLPGSVTVIDDAVGGDWTTKANYIGSAQLNRSKIVNGNLVLCGATDLMVSDDGKGWANIAPTFIAGSGEGNFVDIVWSGSQYVSLIEASGSMYAYTSTNLVDWTRVRSFGGSYTNDPGRQGSSLATDGAGNIIAFIGQSGNGQIYHSTDDFATSPAGRGGLTFGGTASYSDCVAYLGGHFVIFTTFGYAVSDDFFATILNQESVSSPMFVADQLSNGAFVAVGSTDPAGSPDWVIGSSGDGINWSFNVDASHKAQTDHHQAFSDGEQLYFSDNAVIYRTKGGPVFASGTMSTTGHVLGIQNGYFSVMTSAANVQILT